MGIFKKDPMKQVEKEIKKVKLKEDIDLMPMSNAEVLKLIGRCFIHLSERKPQEVKDEHVAKVKGED